MDFTPASTSSPLPHCHTHCQCTFWGFELGVDSISQAVAQAQEQLCQAMEVKEVEDLCQWMEKSWEAQMSEWDSVVKLVDKELATEAVGMLWWRWRRSG